MARKRHPDTRTRKPFRRICTRKRCRKVLPRLHFEPGNFTPPPMAGYLCPEHLREHHSRELERLYTLRAQATSSQAEPRRRGKAA